MGSNLVYDVNSLKQKRIMIGTIDTVNENAYSQGSEDTPKRKKIKIEQNIFKESSIIEYEDDTSLTLVEKTNTKMNETENDITYSQRDIAFQTKDSSITPKEDNIIIEIEDLDMPSQKNNDIIEILDDESPFQ